ncbi:MAG: transglutaminase domain-containing protein [Bacteroidota bacterium]
MPRFILWVLAFYMVSLPIHSQGRINRALLKHAREAPVFPVDQIDSLMAYLLAPTHSERGRAEVLAYWVATHTVYDTEAYQKHIIKDEPWKETYQSGIAACSGYSQLYKALCDRAGVECWIIEGYAKSFEYRSGMTFQDTNHAWNIVKVEGNYFPLDITWASGTLKLKWGNRLVFDPYFDPTYLFSSPLSFVEKHLPAQPRWQLLSHPVSMVDFLEWNYVLDMVDRKSPEYSFVDSIGDFVALDFYARKQKDLRDAVYFHRSDLMLANGYYDLAYCYATDSLGSQEHLESAVYYFQKAKDLYQRPNVNLEEMVGHCDRGIQYASVRLNNLRLQEE